MKLSLQRLAVTVLVLGPIAAAAQTLPLVAVTLPNAPQPQSEMTSSTSLEPAAPVSRQSAATPYAAAQDTPGQTSGATKQHPDTKNRAADQLEAEKGQRMLGIVPEFNTVNGEDALPLMKKQKFSLWWASSIDPFTFAIAGVNAGIEQAEDSYPGYHQGAEGFAKRYAAAYADGVDGNFWGNAVLPILLRQDPRYFRLGHGTAKRRLIYAALSTVRTRGDNGNWQANYSNVAGNLIAGAISNIYYPASDRGVGLIFERGFTVTAEGALGSLAYEFYPDAIAYLKRRHERREAAKAGLALAQDRPITRQID